MAAELARYARNPAPDVVLVLTHAGGAKGKELLAATRGSGARVIECPKVTRFAERLDFIRSEFRRAGARADDGAARALLDAVGSDLRELAAACDQLAADAQDAGGGIDETVVARYYRGRAEATGFTVADRAVEGNLAQSLEQLRWALATGVSPVLICSALAQGVRLLGRVGSAPRGASSASLAAEVGAPPWKIDRVASSSAAGTRTASPAPCTPSPRRTPRSRAKRSARPTPWNGRSAASSPPGPPATAEDAARSGTNPEPPRGTRPQRDASRAL